MLRKFLTTAAAVAFGLFVATTLAVVNQLGDGGPDGVTFPNTKFGAYGTTPAAQSTGPDQAAVSRANAAGVVATYSSSQSPAAVANISTAEQTLTIQSGTGGSMLLASGDVLFVNKPTAQAGLGVGNVRVSSSNTLGVTFDNVPAGGNITPTGAQAYSLVAVRGLGNLSATLSPAAVAANSTVEQTFTVAGLIPGNLVQVMKPTAQTGLDIAGVRITAKDTLGITFMNPTAASITPTASEVYTVLQLGGLDSLNNDVMYGMNVGTVGAIGAGTVVTGGSTTLTGVLATDVVTGVMKPTIQAAATNAAIPYSAVPTANTMTLSFFGVGTGYTPTASEVYGIRTWRLNPAAPLKLYSQSLAPVSVATLTCAEQTFTVTGLVSGSVVWANKPTAQLGLGIAGMRVSATDTLAVNYCNTSAAAIVPTTETYTIGNFQVPAPGAGNVVYQSVSPMVHAHLTLLNSIRSALSSIGWIKGSS